ncbi:PIG-L family deacetylase [bacterium]|nr:PIG-L family deacetylase [bacterium]
MTLDPAKSGRFVALAVAAHPDDIEFYLAGTLLRLKEAGAEIHMWNIANGSCGTAVHRYEEIVRLRGQEARDSAVIARASLHEPLVNDLAVFYEPELVRRVSAVIREIHPNIILTQPPQDYMEDHQNTCRLVVSGAFFRGMRNYATNPPRDPWGGDTAIYHCMPHGLRDGLRRLHRPGQYVDVGPVMETKKEMLSQHRSQKDWLDTSQGMGSYVQDMVDSMAELGRMSGRYEFAEGWRRHLHMGLGPVDYDPLSEMLGEACWTDPEYEESLG